MSGRELPGSSDYRMAVHALQIRATRALRNASGRAERRAAIAELIAKAYSVGMVAQELIDMFCVSTPNVVEDAGIPDGEIDEVIAIFDKLHQESRRGMGGGQ